ncbi:MAG TPA: type I pullulanase [Chthoniobacteraceae bacterium]|nr:type I pullulanase [Chthoniobacteraceae bacterium]
MPPPARRRDETSGRLLVPLLIFCLAFLAGCNVENQSQNASPAPAPAGASPTPYIPEAVPETTAQPPQKFTSIPTAKPRDRITVHYHRMDGDYSTAGLWTWDAYQKHTPAKNELEPLGIDDYGAVFQLDRQRYGESDRIGLLPRMSRDWTRKDGTDRIWTPSLGNEVWILSGNPAVYSHRPDLRPHLDQAFADKTNALQLILSEPVDSAKVSANKIHIADEHGNAVMIEQAQAASPIHVQVDTSSALDFAAHSYTVAIDGLGAPQPLIPRGVLDDTQLYYNADAQLGAIYSPMQTVFRVFAPTAHSASVVLYDQPAGDAGRQALPMHSAGQGIWEAAVTGNLAGKCYMLLPLGPGLPGKETLDPYATNTVNSSSRARITPPTPAPPPLLQKPDAPEDMIIYEMHVRDFTIAPNSGVNAPGLYLGWTQGNTRLPGDARIHTAVDHLAELGVTDVQIMPVQDFANDEYARAYNWGYVTTAFFSPEGMYASNPADDSRIRELKALIAALHARGIGVIMDVVYNHTSDTAPFFDMAPNYYYRRLPDGSLANGSGCGNEFRSEGPMVRKYILDSLKYWVREYGVDGFRFDLMALIDRDTMTDIVNELHAINPAIAVYGEPWTGGDSPLQDKTDKTALLQVPAGAFNDDYRNALHGHPDGPDTGFIQDGSHRDDLEHAMEVSDWLSGPGQSINYMTCHDNLVLWDKLKLSMPEATGALIKRTAKLGYLILLTSQGVPFMQGGEEFGRTKGGDDNSYISPDSVNEVDWSLKAKNYDMFTYVRDLIRLRKEHPLFRLRTREEIHARQHFLPAGEGLAYEIDGSGVPGETWTQALVIANPDNDQPLSFPLPGGDWEMACDANGATMGQTFNGTVSVPAKTGLVLYRQ